MLEAARRLFVERGYDATTMDDVCVETGLAK
ncbi:helix-turn-helix domain-containing protein, partial [Vibrio parahaemolyticus]